MPAGLLESFAIAFGVVFLAELGDKTQLLVLGFATRYPALPVAVGVSVATALLMAATVVAGAALGALVPVTLVLLIGGIAFLLFAVWTLIEREEGDDEPAVAAAGSRPSRSSTVRTAVTVGAVYTVAELGDKSMLATLALAAQSDPLATWGGATLAMVVLDIAAIVVGRQIGARVPRRIVRYIAAAAFAIFGVLLLFEALA